MENKVKVIAFGLLPAFLLGCQNSAPKEIDVKSGNKHTLFEENIGQLITKNNEMTFEVRCVNGVISEINNYYKLKNHTIQFFALIKDADTIPITELLDKKTFKMLGLTRAERLKIRNPYFLDGRMNCYYMDKNYVFAYLDQSTPEFRIIGSSKDPLEFLGGNYLKVNDKIFSRGILLDSVDVKNFHTQDEPQFHFKSEWFLTIGLDNTYIYRDNKKMTKSDFNYFIDGNDSLRKIYFP